MIRSTGPTRRTVLTTGAAAAAVPLAAGAAHSAASAAEVYPTGRLATARADGDSRGARVLPGADVAAAQDWAMLRGQRVGVLTNPTGVLRSTRHIVDDMALHDIEVVGVFGPEHGFRGTGQAGEGGESFEDPRTGFTVYDAYGAGPERFAELFTTAGVQTLVFDICDIGVRFYTYMWALYQAMVGAYTAGVRVLVLDRPNPIGGHADGPMMTSKYTSGVGLREVVQRHGMTVGELARFYNGEFLAPEQGGRAELDVVRARGWRGDLLAQDLDAPWVPPSPNIPTPDSATVYAGTCYFEGTNLSEGRGTTRPFEFVGGPYLDYHWSDRLNARGLPGVLFREAYFIPTFHKHVGEECAGVQLHVTDPGEFDAIRTGVAMLVEASGYDEFAWRYDDWDDERPYWIDKLSGSPRLRTMIDAGADVDEIVDAWSEELATFERQRRPYLLYPGRRG